jgi:hypothetical protein
MGGGQERIKTKPIRGKKTLQSGGNSKIRKPEKVERPGLHNAPV